METHLNGTRYIPYFAVSPYGIDTPAVAIQAARRMLETQLGGPCQVLSAKAAFEDAGGRPALWDGIYPPAITRWSLAAQAAAQAAFEAAPPLPASIEDIEQLNEAYIDVIGVAQYAYSDVEWLHVFAAHFGMSDYCPSYPEALASGRRWLSITPGACPIAAADQELRMRCRSVQQPALASEAKPGPHAHRPPDRLARTETLGAPACF